MNRFRVVIVAAALLAPGLAMSRFAHAQTADAEPSTRSAEPTPVERANADAVAKLEQQIVTERLDNSTTVAQLLEHVDGRAVLVSGLSEAEQIGGPRYVTDELVQVQRQISGRKVATLLRRAVEAKPEQCPVSRERLEEVLTAWERRAFVSTGNSEAATTTAAATANQEPTSPAIAIPDRAPAWVFDPIVSSAHASASGSQLVTARMAERSARDQLRQRVQQLRLTEQHTLADLMAANGRAGDLIQRAVDNARVVGVDYHGDGSVDIRIAIDGQRLWQTIQLAR